MTDADIAGFLGPLSARSIIASVLLGSHPPRLRAGLLVAFTREFGVAEGATRVALSRMVERGELVNNDGVYELTGALRERQHRQEVHRRPVTGEGWDGHWEQGVVTASGRSATDRSRLRRALVVAGLGELREGVWMRPANLDRTPGDILSAQLADHVTWFDALPTPGSAARLVARVFDLDGWAVTAEVLIAAMGGANPLTPSAGSVLAANFRLAAAALQHMVHDPLLPAELAPSRWPATALRERYDQYEHQLQADLRRFFTTR